MTAASESIGAARWLAMRERPYLASAIASLIPVEVTKKGTDGKPLLRQGMGADKHWRLYFDAEAVGGLSTPEAAGTMIHLTTHLIRAHAERALDNFAEPELWGIGGDEEINDDLLTWQDLKPSGDIKLPDNAITPETFGHPTGMMVEQYYDQLLEDAPDNDSDLTGGENCGSAATGIPMEWEEPCETGPDGISKTEANLIRRLVARQIKDHQQAQGNTPEGWKRWAEETLKQPFDFKRMFQSVIRNHIGNISGMVDYTYSRRSRRQGTSGNVILPSMVAPKITVGVIVDTSGSMSDQMIGQALAICRGCLETANEIKVCSCDSAVQKCQSVFRPQNISVFGGGGTDMRVPIKLFEDMPQNQRPLLVLTVTDGYTPWPKTAPTGFKHITLLTSENGSRPTFGETYIWDRSPPQDNWRTNWEYHPEE